MTGHAEAAEPRIFGQVPVGAAGPAQLTLLPALTLIADAADPAEGELAVVEHMDAPAELDALGPVEDLRPLAQLALAETLLRTVDALLPRWMLTLNWLVAWSTVPPRLAGFAPSYRVAKRGARAMVREIEETAAAGATLRRARGLVAEIEASEALEAALVRQIRTAIENATPAADVRPLHDERPHGRDRPRPGIASEWGRRALALDLADLRGPAASRWRTCAELWAASFKPELAEQASARAAAIERTLVRDIVPRRPAPASGDGLRLVADRGVSLNEPSSKPLELELHAHGSEEPVAGLSVHIHSGWIKLVRRHGPKLIWTPTGQEVEDLVVEEDLPVNLDDLKTSLRFSER